MEQSFAKVSINGQGPSHVKAAHTRLKRTLKN